MSSWRYFAMVRLWLSTWSRPLKIPGIRSFPFLSSRPRAWGWGFAERRLPIPWRSWNGFAVKGRLWSWFDPPDRSGACRGCSPNTTPLRRNGTPSFKRSILRHECRFIFCKGFFRQGLWCRRFLSRWSPKKISSPKFPGIGPNPKARPQPFCPRWMI